MKIISLEASNVKRLQAVEIRPEGNTVIVGGKNGAGKTSVLDSISAALGGKKLCPRVPIRRGQKTAEVRVELDDLIVIRRWNATGSYLAVENKDGSQHRSPQAILDALVGRLTFDPLAFLRQDPREQTITIQEYAGLDFADLYGKRAHAYDARRDINRDLKAAKAQLDGMVYHEDAPAKPVSVADLMRDLEDRRAANQANEDQRREIARRRTELQHEAAAAKDVEARVTKEREERLREQQGRVTRLRAELEEAERHLVAVAKGKSEAVQAAKQITEEAAAALAAGSAKLGAETAALVDQPTKDLVAEIAGAEDVNRKIHDNAVRTQQTDVVAVLQEKSEDWTTMIEGYDAQRLATIEAAKFPIDGLGVTDDGVTFDGLPLEQASSAEQLRISVAMGLAMNPKLPVLLIRDGSLLDKDSLELLRSMAEKADAQLWIERVGIDGASVVIEDGAIAGAGERDGS